MYTYIGIHKYMYINEYMNVYVYLYMYTCVIINTCAYMYTYHSDHGTKIPRTHYCTILQRNDVYTNNVYIRVNI